MSSVFGYNAHRPSRYGSTKKLLSATYSANQASRCIRNNILNSFLSAVRLFPPGGRWEFIWSDTGHPLLGGSIAQLKLDFSKLNRTGILAIVSGEEIFEDQSVAEAIDTLQSFIESNYGKFAYRIRRGWEINLRDILEESEVDILASEFLRFSALRTIHQMHLLPVWNLRVPSAVITETIALIPGGTVADTIPEVFHAYGGLDLAKYPCVDVYNERQEFSSDNSWAVAFSNSDKKGTSRLTQLCGAISLALDFPHSRQITAADYPDGMAIVEANGKYKFRHNGPRIPSLQKECILSAEQADWLRRIFLFIESDTERSRRMATSLEYIAAGWGSIGRLGFLHNAIAFDALFGEMRNTTSAIKMGISTYASAIPRVTEKASLLLDIRHQVLHGRNATVEATGAYKKYWTEFEVDPQYDQIVILIACFKGIIETQRTE